MGRGYQSVEAGFSWVGPWYENFDGVITGFGGMIGVADPGGRIRIRALQHRAFQDGVGSSGFGVPPQTQRTL